MTYSISPKLLAEINKERNKQIDKGFTADHDDTYLVREMSQAAAMYTMSAVGANAAFCHNLNPWPLSTETSKIMSAPPRENLIKALALIIADIERMDRYNENYPSNNR